MSGNKQANSNYTERAVEQIKGCEVADSDVGSFVSLRMPRQHRAVDSSKIMSVGILTLNRFNGQEQFSISEATIFLYNNDGYDNLSFEIETDEKPIKTLPDTESLCAQPNAEFTVRVTDFSWENLVGRCFEIPQGYDAETKEFLTRLYYCEHEVTDNNVIKVLERKDDRFRVKIEATCTDVNYYDGSKPPTKVEIDAWFNPRQVSENV